VQGFFAVNYGGSSLRNIAVTGGRAAGHFFEQPGEIIGMMNTHGRADLFNAQFSKIKQMTCPLDLQTQET
jgi:hypothetical protein